MKCIHCGYWRGRPTGVGCGQKMAGPGNQWQKMLTCLDCGGSVDFHMPGCPSAKWPCPECGGQSAHQPTCPVVLCPEICLGCQRRIALYWSLGDPLGETAFAAAIGRCAGEGQLCFTASQLYYDVARRSRPHLMRAKRSFLGQALRAAMEGGLSPFAPERCARDLFDDMLRRWQYAHGRIAGLISAQAGVGLVAPQDPGLAGHSFDRAVICEQAETVDFLLANRFHFENNCAVLSVDGYPPGPFPLVRRMLRQNPQLVVYALHDATPAGCRLAHRLAADPEWFGGVEHPAVRIVDVGLRPAQADGLKGNYSRAGWACPAEPGIPEAEAVWLSDKTVDLAAIPPEVLLRRLQVAVNRAETLGALGMREEIGASPGENEASGYRSLYWIDTGSLISDDEGGLGDSDGFG